MGTDSPSLFERPLFAPQAPPGGPIPASRGPRPYLFGDEQVVAAVNVALATERPLLVTGPPGSGKSSLATAVAHELNWTYLETVMTSRTELSDLTEGFDAIRRLGDAQVQHGLAPRWAYVEPGALWWAFAPSSASRRGQSSTEPGLASQPAPRDPRHRGEHTLPATVVLLDEIDKAEPDLPNDLLIPLDRRGFDTREAGWQQAEHDLLVVITSNGERRLPSAFLRRCVHLELVAPDVEMLVAVAELRLGTDNRDLYIAVAHEFARYRSFAKERSNRQPSTAEYLDTVTACLRLGAVPEQGAKPWQSIVAAALWKSEYRPGEAIGYERSGN